MSKILIITIVPCDEAGVVIEAAEKAGATGGTIIHARGSKAQESASFLGVSFEPEKEMVLIVTDELSAGTICKSIRSTSLLQNPDTGFMFTLPVQHAEGLI